jgi:hypothetical protein
MRVERAIVAGLQKFAHMIVVPACDALKRRGTRPHVTKALRATG